ncbi:MAG: hypothetical protein K6E16_07415 [Lachnospiraceae bacterium]|nr:hypothetical protein [Lachnospiraceae bacterium]
MKKTEKGKWKYIKQQQLIAVIRTVILFLLSLGLYAVGYITTGSNRNLLTIIAVLGLLPAAKSMVNMIMFLRFRSLTQSAFTQYEEKRSGLSVLYENILTTKEQAYYVPVLAYRNRTICAYCPGSGDLKTLESHLRECMKTEGIDITAKVFSDERPFFERLATMSQMSESESELTETERVFSVVKAVSL